MKLNIEFHIGQSVYLKTDDQQKQRIVTGITIRPNSMLVYHLAMGDSETAHFGIEISNEPDQLKVLGCKN